MLLVIIPEIFCEWKKIICISPCIFMYFFKGIWKSSGIFMNYDIAATPSFLQFWIYMEKFKYIYELCPSCDPLIPPSSGSMESASIFMNYTLAVIPSFLKFWIYGKFRYIYEL
jgi:hypothetical protein